MMEKTSVYKLASNSAKDTLRAKMIELRKSIPATERIQIDEAICKQVCSLPEFIKADAVFSYLSFGSEIETRDIIKAAWALKKDVALPHCVGLHCMRWFRILSFDSLEKSSFGVEEPPIVASTEMDFNHFKNPIAIVPGLAFDNDGFRLGYGGGYYDNFLAHFSGVSVGLCRPQQRLSSFSMLGALDSNDQPVDIIVQGTCTTAELQPSHTHC